MGARVCSVMLWVYGCMGVWLMVIWSLRVRVRREMCNTDLVTQIYEQWRQKWGLQMKVHLVYGV